MKGMATDDTPPYHGRHVLTEMSLEMRSQASGDDNALLGLTALELPTTAAGDAANTADTGRSRAGPMNWSGRIKESDVN